MEDALYDHMAERILARVEVEQAPDETTICKFRHLSIGAARVDAATV